MKSHALLFLSSLLILRLLLPAQNPAQDPAPLNPPSLDDRLSRAVLAVMDGDDQAAQGNKPAAAALYREALALLETIRDEDPAFNTNIVEFRIENLQSKLAELSPAEPAPPAPTPAPEHAPGHFERLYLDAKEKSLADAQRLLEVERRNLDLQLALRERDTLLNEQRTQLQQLRRDLSALQTTARTQSEDAARELQSLQRFNTLLQERANTLEADNTTLQESLAAARERDAERGLQVQDLRDQLLAAEQALTAASERHTAEKQALQNQLTECNAEARKRFDELSRANDTITALQEQLTGLPLLEETVLELNRRLNQQTLDLEALQTAKADAEILAAENQALEAALAETLETLSHTLNQLTQARRELQTRSDTPAPEDTSDAEAPPAAEPESDPAGVGVPDELMELELESDR